MAPRITIGITCYNAEDTITRAIASACAQDWPDVEILVVDDCSSDNSRKRIAALIGANRNIIFIPHAENKGYAAGLNTLLNYATGEFIAFFDDDDTSEPDRLRRQYERLTAYEATLADKAKPVLCYANRNIVKPGKDTVDHVAYAIGRQAPEPQGLDVADYLLWHSGARSNKWGLFGSCTLFARTSVLKALGFDEAFRRSAEFDMAVRAAKMGAHFIAVDAPLITQYKTPTSDKAGTIPLKYALKLREKHQDYLATKGVYKAARMMARHHYANHAGRKGRGLLFLALASVFAPKLLGWEKLSATWRKMGKGG